MCIILKQACFRTFAPQWYQYFASRQQCLKYYGQLSNVFGTTNLDQNPSITNHRRGPNKTLLSLECACTQLYSYFCRTHMYWLRYISTHCVINGDLPHHSILYRLMLLFTLTIHFRFYFWFFSRLLSRPLCVKPLKYDQTFYLN